MDTEETKNQLETGASKIVVVRSTESKKEDKDNGSSKEPKKESKKEGKSAASKKDADSDFQYVNVEKIVVEQGGNHRKVFDRESLKGLADSIRQVGVLNPLTVCIRDGKYTLIAGERRLRASKIAGLTVVPVFVIPDNPAMNELARFIENAQDDNLSPLEEAMGLKRLLGKTYPMPDNTGKPVPTVLNVKNLSQLIGKTPGYVSQRLTLLELHKDIQQALLKGEVSLSQARELHSAGDEKLQLKLLAKIRGSDDSVRVKDIKSDIDKSKAKRRVADAEGKRRGRPPKEDGVIPNVARQGLEAALQHLADVKLEVKKVTEVREGMAMVYEKFDKAKSDEKKMFYKGAIAALEWATGIKEDL